MKNLIDRFPVIIFFCIKFNHKHTICFFLFKKLQHKPLAIFLIIKAAGKKNEISTNEISEIKIIE